MKEATIKRLNEIILKQNYKLFRDTKNMLIQKGTVSGAYQDYTVLLEILEILTLIEKEVADRREKK